MKRRFTFNSLSSYTLRIKTEADLIKYRKFVCGEISRQEAYPIFMERLPRLLYSLAFGGLVVDMLSKEE